MKTFTIEHTSIGEVVTIAFSDGFIANSLEQLIEKLSEEKETFYGSGVHKISVMLGGINFKHRKYPTASGDNVKIVVKKSTLVDISSWNFKYNTPEELLDLLNEASDGGEIVASPTVDVINSYRDSVISDYDSLLYASRSRLSFTEAYLGSSRIGERDFRPAYAGGLNVCTADSRRLYHDVISFDIASAYPWAALTGLVPVSEAMSIEGELLDSLEIVDGTINLGENIGFIGKFSFYGVSIRQEISIPLFKWENKEWCSAATADDDGTIVSGDLTLALTKPDLENFLKQYDVESYSIEVLEAHQLGRIPDAATEYLKSIYMAKKTATGVARDKAKTAINTVIGLWGKDPFERARVTTKKDDGRYLRDYHNIYKAHFDYAGSESKRGMVIGGVRTWDFRWAMYATAYNRSRIIDADIALYHAGLQVLYCDTDSIKMIGDRNAAEAVFDSLNIQVIIKNTELDLPDGIGMWVDESDNFKTAVFKNTKAYASLINGVVEPHISGVNRDHSKQTLNQYTMQELADMEKWVIRTTTPRIGELVDPHFGAKIQLLEPQHTRKVGK